MTLKEGGSYPGISKPGLEEGVVSHQDGLSTAVPRYRGSSNRPQR